MGKKRQADSLWTQVKCIILLDAGSVAACGTIDNCIDKYTEVGICSGSSIKERITKCHHSVVVDAVLVNGSDSTKVELSSSDRTLSIDFTGKLLEPLCIEIEAKIVDQHNVPLAFFSPGHERGKSDVHSAQDFHLNCTMEIPERVNRGSYYLNIFLTHPNKIGYVDIPHAVELEFEGFSTQTGHTLDYRDGKGWLTLPEVLS